MPNLRGGKAYKKGKKAPTDPNERIGKFIPRDDDQDYARVISMLGNRRVLCLCNDGRERVCKIRGSICKGSKKQIIEVSDIVLISFREYGNASDDEEAGGVQATETKPTGNAQIHSSGRKEIADILQKIHRSHWHHIATEPNIHKDLFGVSTNATEDIFDYSATVLTTDEINAI